MSTLTFRKISWEKFHQDCLVLSHKLKEVKIDKIVAISRGGLVPARLLSDLLSIPISHLTITSYENLEQEKEPFIDEAPTKTFNGETILIVDDVSDTGKTFERALSYFKNFSVKKIYTLAIYRKPHTNHVPDFCAETIDAWIIYPYELHETALAFVKMFGTVDKAREKLQELGFAKWEMSL